MVSVRIGYRKIPAFFFCRRAKRGPHREGIAIRSAATRGPAGRAQTVRKGNETSKAGPQPGADKAFALRMHFNAETSVCQEFGT